MEADPLPPIAPKIMGPDLAGGESSCLSPPPMTYQPRLVGAALRNLGNTCFLNAVLQCLTHTVPLVQKIRKTDHSRSCCGSNGGFCSFCALREHINHCLFLSGFVVSPTDFAENLSKLSHHFQLGQQEDAHEFLHSLLDNIHSCCLGRSSKDWPSSLDEDSLVKQVFGGRLRSQLRCCHCGHYSDTFEPVLDLSLEIDNVDSVIDALASFTKLEKIDDPEIKFTCEGCRAQVSMEKQLKLEQAPEVLALHLKRFKNNGGLFYKIHDHVEYPLELDLNPCLSCPADEVQLKYDLYAVLVHLGSSYSGHYFCFIRSSPSTWHQIDDSKVTRVSESDVLDQNAYVLFYVKQGSSCWFSNLMREDKTLNIDITTDTSPTSVLDHAERYHSSLVYEDSCSSSRGTPERHDDADPCSHASPISPTNDVSCIGKGEGYYVEASSMTSNHWNHGNSSDKVPSDWLIAQPTLEKEAEKTVTDPLAIQPGGWSMSIQHLEDMFDDEPLEHDKENHLVPQVQVEFKATKEARKPALEAKQDARMHEPFNRLVRGMPRSRRSGILACIASHQKSSRKQPPNMSQFSGNKRIKCGSDAHFLGSSNSHQQRSTPAEHSASTSCQSLSPRSIRRGLFVHDSSL